MTCLKRYVELTEPVRDGHDPFWLSFTKPFKPVSQDTVSRWIKSVMEKAGIDNKIFSAHSTRAAATSAANANNVSINTIMDAAGWSRERVLLESFMTNQFKQMYILGTNLSQHMIVQTSNKWSSCYICSWPHSFKVSRDSLAT